MKVTFTKGRREDWIVIARDDGSRAETRFPHKGPVPHDAVHLFVESGLNLKRGFWGMVAEGTHPQELLEIAKAAGHASAKRASVPGAEIVELLQAERLVEVFEADLWSGGDDEDTFIDIARTACCYSHVPMPAFPEGSLAQIRAELAEFALSWTSAPVGRKAEFSWP